MELNSTPDPLVQLPPEIRDKIYNFLEQKDALIFRFVSKQYRDEIDSMFRFNIKLDDEKLSPDQIEFLLNKKIEKCHLIRLLKERTTLPIFKYPNIICMELTIRSNISSINFHTVMQEICPSVQSFDISFNLDYNNVTVPRFMDVIYDFVNLKQLRIEQHAEWNQGRHFVRKIFESARKSRLKSLDVKFRHNILADQTETQNEVFSFVLQHSRTLKRFRYESGYIIGRAGMALSYDQAIASRLSEVNTIKEFCLILPQIRYTHDYNLPRHEVSSDNDLSMKFLQSQHQLEKLEITALECSEEIYAELQLSRIVLRNVSTLKSVSLNIEPRLAFKRNLDLSVFQDCQSLKFLSLHLYNRDETEFEMNDVEFDWNLVDLCLLPKSIEHLKIIGFKILSSEMEAYFGNEKELKSLQFLKLICGYAFHECHEYGVNDSVLDTILSLKSLLQITILDLKLSNECRRKINSLISSWHSHGTQTCACNFENNTINLIRET